MTQTARRRQPHGKICRIRLARVFVRLIDEYPALRFFPDMVGRRTAMFWDYHRDLGFSDIEFLDMALTDAGVISLGGVVFAGLLGEDFGCDQAVVELMADPRAD